MSDYDSIPTKKMKKIFKISATLIIASILSPILAQGIEHAIIDKSETSNNSIAFTKANENLSKPKINIAKKRTKIDEAVLSYDLLFEILPHLDRILSIFISSLTITKITKYAVWSKSTFS
jgi:hypothetical protein